MSALFDADYLIRRANINYILIGILLTISIASHVIANRFVEMGGYPIIPSTFTYMAIFIGTDLLAAFNTKRFVIAVLVFEVVFNLMFLIITNSVNQFDAPTFFAGSESYRQVFSLVVPLYVGNLIGTLAASLIELNIFYYCYRIKNLNFLFSSLFSTSVFLIIYTYITDYLAFYQMYPENIFEISSINVVTNFVSIVFYAVIANFMLRAIKIYLD